MTLNSNFTYIEIIQCGRIHVKSIEKFTIKRFQVDTLGNLEWTSDDNNVNINSVIK